MVGTAQKANLYLVLLSPAIMTRNVANKNATIYTKMYQRVTIKITKLNGPKITSEDGSLPNVCVIIFDNVTFVGSSSLDSREKTGSGYNATLGPGEAV